MTDSRKLKLGLLAITLNAFLYTLVYIFLTIGDGAPLSLTPWLAIPRDVYYSYNRFILAPNMFGCWILQSAA